MHNNVHVLRRADGACIPKFCWAAPRGIRHVSMTDVGGGRVAVCSGQYREETREPRVVVVLHVSPPTELRAVHTRPGGIALALV